MGRWNDNRSMCGSCDGQIDLLWISLSIVRLCYVALPERSIGSQAGRKTDSKKARTKERIERIPIVSTTKEGELVEYKTVLLPSSSVKCEHQVARLEVLVTS